MSRLFSVYYLMRYFVLPKPMVSNCADVWIGIGEVYGIAGKPTFDTMWNYSKCWNPWFTTELEKKR